MSSWRDRMLEVRLGPPGHGGFCVARYEGRVVFVRHGLPDELVAARVTEDRGGAFCRADAVDILEPSPDRVPRTCPVSGPGGAGCCDFAHATPSAQRALKSMVVAEQLRRIAGMEREPVVEPIPGPPDSAGGWRTRIRLVVDAAGRAGVHRYRSADVLPDLRCPQPVPAALDGIAGRRWTPGADLVVAVDDEGHRHIVELAPAPQPGEFRGAVPRDARRGPGDRRRSAPRKPERRAGPGESLPDTPNGQRRRAVARRAAAHTARDEWVAEGTGRAVQYVAGRRWDVSAAGFWQAHRGAAERYSDLVAEWADPAPGATAWDLYSGVGVFAARLAAQTGSAGTVYAVESAPGAVADGNDALGDLPWLTLQTGRVERWVADRSESRPQVVVLDPPRAGAGKPVISAVTAAAPDRIVHIGCDPASFARDLRLYLDAGYRLGALRAFDAFPATHHVECLALLER
ncbi:class I SAM-dependent RNA methyltransferase [Nocardia flavorosea]|uniref:Class I SAM-dependent RNA methyltransferase n=1 Tax=Nocardia flavorosea TaxID=53429 RepID=A0A846YJH6_9NOCA|nr:TRAM domain-containing protein [Nocardia flavorosea]NKY59766.1 class I SAM-dependent RNA methyltransferase [Nocardia flavorosea]